MSGIDRIVILGSGGMLGRYLKCYFENKGYMTFGIERNRYDVMRHRYQDLEDLLFELALNDRSLVINCIGVIPHASKDHMIDDATYIKINTVFSQILAQMCKAFNAHLIHPTTDCVYSGDKGMYKENDPHDEKNIYGITKSLGEPELATVIRCSIIGEELKNKRSFLEWVRSNEDGQVNGYTNHYWNGVTCLQYAKIIETMIQKNLFWKGVRHIHSPDVATKNDMVNWVNETYELNIKIIPYTCAQKCDRTLASNYDCSIFEIPNIETQIKELYQFKLF